MGSLTASSVLLLPSKLVIKSRPLSSNQQQQSALLFYSYNRGRSNRNTKSSFPVMRLFGPAIFEASKLKVLFLGTDDKKHPGKLPRTYTLTHSDITAKLTLAISQTINNSQLQGWANKIFRDEVVAEWRKVKGKMSLHVHCHISGGHFLLDFAARLRYYIFCKELPVVLKAFVHADEDLFNNYPELEESPVWVYFHSNVPEFNKVECWGLLKEATAVGSYHHHHDRTNDVSAARSKGSENEAYLTSNWKKSQLEEPCKEACNCCFPPISVMQWPSSKSDSEQDEEDGVGTGQTVP